MLYHKDVIIKLYSIFLKMHYNHNIDITFKSGFDYYMVYVSKLQLPDKTRKNVPIAISWTCCTNAGSCVLLPHVSNVVLD